MNLENFFCLAGFQGICRNPEKNSGICLKTTFNHFLKVKIFRYFFSLFAFLFYSFPIAAQQSDTIIKKQFFEVSFGQSMMFVSDKKLLDIHNESAVNIPTSSLLFFVEFRPQKKIKIPVFFNLPTETRQFLVNGQLINERVSPTFGTGLEFNIFRVKIHSESRLNFEAGPLASFVFDNKDDIRFAPMLAGRTMVTRGDNFVMYFGGSYSIGINILGIFFGTGTVF